MNSFHSTRQAPEPVMPLAMRRPGRRWSSVVPKAPVWFALLATLGALALLMSFRQVVLQGVQQAESRHRASAAHANGVWHCNTLSAVGQRQLCREQINAGYASGWPVASVER